MLRRGRQDDEISCAVGSGEARTGWSGLSAGKGLSDGRSLLGVSSTHLDHVCLNGLENMVIRYIFQKHSQANHIECFSLTWVSVTGPSPE